MVARERGVVFVNHKSNLAVLFLVIVYIFSINHLDIYLGLSVRVLIYPIMVFILYLNILKNIRYHKIEKVFFVSIGTVIVSELLSLIEYTFSTETSLFENRKSLVVFELIIFFQIIVVLLAGLVAQWLDRRLDH